MSWETNADSMVMRSLIEFDAASIPAGAIVEAAYLTLYATEGSFNPGHFGDNAASVCRITSAWDAETVNWENQPSADPSAEVQFSELASPLTNLEQLDITALVQDMLTDGDTTLGLSLLLQSEEIYKSINFASSDHENETLRPTLVVRFENPVSTGIEENALSAGLNLYPNPASTHATVQFMLNQPSTVGMEIYDLQGKLVKVVEAALFPAGNVQLSLSLSELPAGHFIAALRNSDTVLKTIHFQRI